MDAASSRGLPRRWREEKPTAANLPPTGGRSRLKTAFLVFAVILGILVAIGGMLSMLGPAPSPHFLPLWILDQQSPSVPLVPMAERDRESICAGGYFIHWSRLTTARQDGSLLMQDLANLKNLQAKDTVVAYLSAHAVLAGEGRIHVLPSDADPDNSQSWVPLKDILEKLRDCPARGKLLVLDIMKPVNLSRLGSVYHDVAGAVAAELEAVPDPRRLVLSACAPGQAALVSEELGRSVFSFYFEEGLRGYADGYGADGRRDSQVTVRELAAFVRARVDRWAVKNRATRQTPVLYGSGGDFALAALDHGQPKVHLPPAPVRSYPARLLEAWQMRDSWWTDTTYRHAPRIFQEIQASLLEMEKNWRGGFATARLQQDLESFQKLRDEITRQRALFEPKAVSLAQEELAGRKPDEAIKKTFQEFMENLQKHLAGTRAEDAENLKTKWRAAIQEQLKDKPAFDVESAMFAWTTADAKYDAGMLRFLDDVLRQSGHTQPRYVETLLLRQLADLVYRVEGKKWPGPTVGRILQVARQGERAAADPLAFPWIVRQLEEACQARHDAEICLWATGYASLSDADGLAKTANERYASILAAVCQVRQAHAVLEEALALLPSYVPLLDQLPGQQQHWSRAAAAARDLAEALANPSRKHQVHDPKAKIAEIERLTRHLAEPLQELNMPFGKENVVRLKEVCSEPLALQQLEAVLSVPAPSLKGDDRAALWGLARELARKLHEETVQLDRDEDQKRLVTDPPPPYAAMREESKRAGRRARNLLALLTLGGLSNERLQPARDLLAGLNPDNATASDWCALGKVTRQLWVEQLPAQYRAETSAVRRAWLDWIAPPLETFKAGLEADLPASSLVRLQQVGEQWTWLSGHYRHLARDYEGLGLAGTGPAAAQKFYAQAALANQEFTRQVPEIYATVQRTQAAERLISSQAPVRALIEIQRVLPAGSFGPLDLTIKLPDAAWLEITPSAVRLPDVGESVRARRLASKVPVEIRLKPGAERSFLPRPLGFLAEARFEGRTYHAVMPVPLSVPSEEIQVLVSTNSRMPEPALGDIKLRPNRYRQPYFVYLKNLTPRARKVNLEILLGETLVSGGKLLVALNPEETQRVTLGKAPCPIQGLPEVEGPLVLRATDVDTTALLDQKRLRLEIANPHDYVQVTDVQFDPSSLPGKNKLTVKLHANRAMPGPSISAELFLPGTRIPGFPGADGGTLRRDLAANGNAPPVTLFAENVHRAEGSGEEGPVYLNVDGLERAFIFQTQFARQGALLTPRPDNRPAVRWDVAPYVLAGPKVSFPVEVDNAPPRASLEVSLGRGTDSDFEADLTTGFSQAKQRHIGFWLDGKDGAMIFEAGVRDWAVVWDTSRILGPRVLRARLLDAQGKEIAKAIQKVTIDGNPPTLARILGMPAKIKRGSPIKLHAEGSDPESGIAQVVFFVGQPKDDKIPANLPTIAAAPLDREKTTWTASIQLPEDKKGPTLVSVQFTNGVGLVRYATATVELTDSDPVGLGSIRGKVFEGPRLQPGLEVILRDNNGKEKTRTRTQANGTFLFEDLAPGSYVIFCVKPDSLRRATVPVLVEPNKTTLGNVELSL
jgi:hypothetical protein